MQETIRKINDLQNTVDEKVNLKNSNLSNRKEFYDAKDKLTSEQILLEQESNRLANLLEKANYKIEEITKAMLENYNLTYALAKEKFKEDLGTNEEIKTSVDEISQSFEIIAENSNTTRQKADELTELTDYFSL